MTKEEFFRASRAAEQQAERIAEIKRMPQIRDDDLLRQNMGDSKRKRRGRRYRSVLGEQPVATTQTLLGA